MKTYKQALAFIEAFERGDRAHRLFVWLVQVSLIVFSGFTAFLLRFDIAIPPTHTGYIKYGLVSWVLAKTIVFRMRGLDRGWWRYVSSHDVLQLTISNILASLLGAACILLISPPGFPRSIFFIDFLLCLLATTGLRVSGRVVVDTLAGRREGARILIYGAGNAGVALVREIRSNRTLNFQIVGFVDDDAVKQGLTIVGVPVLGNGQYLAAAVEKYAVQEVWIALPSISGPEMSRIVDRCHEASIKFRTIPGMGDMIEGATLAAQVRDVAVEDLLGRRPVELGKEEIGAKLTGKVVMVTGAAGSIGSELCRQIARFNPAAIIGFEVAETPLFLLERELRQSFPNIPFFPEIGSIQSPERLADVLGKYRPSIFYHAAAYKHVPMMEAHPFEAVKNNILGTYNAARAAAAYGVQDFVMISSDKAVRPTNIMGATKRIAELVVRSMQAPGTSFVSVRFGNVLGSNGSVIPIFKQQIATGGPITVTHPDMRRYFMTIPEAAQLVLQASTMGHGGEIFVLDMGEPVRIVDLARNLIVLSGLRPGIDIKVEFTGPRPGEKLYEEISNTGENTVKTRHPKIRIFNGFSLTYNEMTELLGAFERTIDDRDAARLLALVQNTVPDYHPSPEIQRDSQESPVSGVADEFRTAATPASL